MLNWDDYNESEKPQKTQPIVKEEVSAQIQEAIQPIEEATLDHVPAEAGDRAKQAKEAIEILDAKACLLYTSPSPRDLSTSRMPSSA